MGRTTIRLAMVALGCTVLWHSAAAHEYRSRDMDIVHPWAPPTAAGADQAEIYLTAINHSTAPDRLLGGRTAVAHTVRLVARDDSPASRPGRPAPIEVAFARPLNLGPGAAHVRIVGLRRPLARGDSFTLTLVFARAGAIDVTVVVQETPDH